MVCQMPNSVSSGQIRPTSAVFRVEVAPKTLLGVFLRLACPEAGESNFGVLCEYFLRTTFYMISETLQREIGSMGPSVRATRARLPCGALPRGIVPDWAPPPPPPKLVVGVQSSPSTAYATASNAGGAAPSRGPARTHGMAD